MTDRSAQADETEVFDRGPPRGLSPPGSVRRPLLPNITARVLLVLGLGWLPLLLLSPLGGSEAARDMLADVGAHARFALAAPLLVVGYATCARRLSEVAYTFLASDLLPEGARAAARAAAAQARRRLRSVWSELAVLSLAYVAVGAVYALGPEAYLQSAWQGDRATTTLSPAGWWHVAVSAPLLFVLLLGWVWRTIVWTLFLRRMASLKLRLVAAHPDGAGGLGFLNQSVRAFAVVGMAFGALAAGRLAHVNLHGLATPLSIPLLVALAVVVALAAGLAPISVFTPILLRTWRRGSIAYGALAGRMGQQFEARWLHERNARDMLEVPDFSAATDLYQVAGAALRMRFLPTDVQSVGVLVVASLAPFIPAMFLSMPAEEVIRELRGLVS